MALIASEVCSFDDGDNSGGNEVDGNKDECSEMDLLYYDIDLIC